MKWNPDEIASALDGKENATKRFLDSLVLHLKKLKTKPNESSVEFPSFEDLWDRHLSELKVEPKVIPFNRRTKVIVSMLAAAAAMIFTILYTFPFSPQQEGNSYSMKIHAVSGDAYVLNSDGSRRLHLDHLTSLEKGDRIHVDEGSFVDLFLTSQASIRIRENSDVILEKMIQNLDSHKISIYLSNGSILSHIHKMNKASQFLIRTADSKVEVRGTKFLTENNSGDLTVAVSEGKVLVTQSAGQFSQELESNEEVVQSAGNWQKKALGSKNFRSLAELDYLSIQDVPKEELTRVIQSEEDLYRIYSILEQVSTINGQDYRGVVFKMDENFIYIRTVKGETKIPQSQINEVEKIR